MVAKGVGAVGVPVNDGDAIVALSNMSAVLLVILAVFAVIAFVLLVILAVFAVIAFVLLVMFAVFDAINVGKDAIVDELTPPTLLVVAVNVPVPLPLTSPVNVIT